MNIKIYSRERLEELCMNGFPDNTAVVSYYDDDERPIEFDSNIKHLSVNIEDINPDYIDDKNEWHNDDFAKVASFIKENINQGRDIICQCSYGISRSAATAMAILEYLGRHDEAIKIFANYDYSPNKIFFNKILYYLKQNH